MIAAGAIQKGISSHGGVRPRTYGLVLHVQVGNGSLYSYFGNPNNEVSSAYWISKSGVIEQYFDDSLIGWTQADGNSSWIAVETEGFVDEPLTEAQLNAVASLLSQLSIKYGFPIQNTSDVNGRGLGHHAMGGVAWGNHPCPGPIRIGQKDDIVSRALAITNGTGHIGGGLQQEEEDMTPEQAAQLANINERVTRLSGDQWVALFDRVNALWSEKDQNDAPIADIHERVVALSADQWVAMFDRVNVLWASSPTTTAALQQILSAVANIAIPAGSAGASASDVLNKLGDALKSAAAQS